jgi:hypothetical protein
MEPGTCELWWASTAWMRPWHADVLSDGERARRAGLWDPGHRAQYTVAAALLRLITAPLTERTAAGVVVDRSCPSCGRHHGRPRRPDLRYVGALAVLSPRPVVVRERSAEQLLTAG